MKEKELLQRLNQIPNGRFFKMAWKSELPVEKKYGNQITVTKVTISTVRKGIKYTNTKAYREKVYRKSYEEVMGTSFATPQTFSMNKEKANSLPWGKWKIPNLLIEHTNKAGEYNVYLRLYTTVNKPEVLYYLNDRLITKEALMQTGIVKSSYWDRSKVEDGLFTVNIENILKI